MKGKKPTSGTVTVSTNGKVTSANLCVEGYTVVYNGREVTSTTKIILLTFLKIFGNNMQHS